MSTIGKSVPRRDSEDKLRGRTRYTIDRSHPGMLHAALCRAEVAAARITNIDTTTARSMPGVRAVVSYEDAPGRYGIGIADQPLFAADEVRYYGEPVAAVAAETYEQALAAANAVVVEYEELPANLTMEDALAPNAREIHPDWQNYEVLVPGAERGGNVAWEATVIRGDTDDAFAREDVTIVESQFSSGRQNQTPMESRTCVAEYQDGRFVIETSTQVPWAVRNTIARLLDVPEGNVRVTVPAVGGGFGGKFEYALEPFTALLARASGRPVSLVNSREEEMLTMLCRENADIRIRSAVTQDGDIVGREAVVLMDCGSYGGEQPFLASMTAHTLGGNYKLGSVRIITRAIYTNTAPTGAFRACNGPYNTFALERHTEEICQAIGMDPMEFRRRNVLGDGDMGANGQIFEGDVLAPMLERMDHLIQEDRTLETPNDGRLRGSATVVGTWFVFTGPSAATVNLNPDGSVTLVTSAVEIGSGATVHALPQIVAHELSVKPEDVIVRTADTDAAGYDVGVGGGRTTVSLGAASEAACADAKEKIFDVAADMLEVAPEDLELGSGSVGVVGAPGASVTIAEVAAHAQNLTGPISGSGSFTSRKVPTMPGCVAGHMVDALDIPIFAIHSCDVAVDPETGHVEVERYRVVQDVGRVINPRGIQNQIQGGVIQGIGYALHEEVTIGEDGAIEQRGFESYHVPLAGDVIPVKTDLYEGAPSRGPMGVKGAAEIPILNVAAAIGSAVSNATGSRVQQIPLTPQRVLGLMRGREEPLDHQHIPASWKENVLASPEDLLAAVGL